MFDIKQSTRPHCANLYDIQFRVALKNGKSGETQKLLMFWEIHQTSENRQVIDQDERQSMDCNKLHIVYMFNMKLQIPLLLEWGKQPKRTVHVYSEHDHNALLFLRDTWEEDGRALLIEWCWPAANQVPIRILPIFRDECVYVALPCWNLSVGQSNQSQGGGGSKHTLSLTFAFHLPQLF